MKVAHFGSALLMLTTAVQAAWKCNKPDSPVCPCNCTGVIEIPDLGGAFQFVGRGVMGLQGVSGTEDPDGTCVQQLISTSFYVRMNNPNLGEVVITFDTQRVSPNSTIVNNVPFEQYPATHHVYAHARVTFELNGVEWRTRNPFHMVSNGIDSFHPAINEPYILAGPVEFEDVAAPGTTVATMTGANIMVNGSVPTVSTWGVAILSLLLLVAGTMVARRHTHIGLDVRAS